MEIITQADIQNLINSSKQYEFLIYNSIIAEIEKNIQNSTKNNFTNEVFTFNKKHCSLNIDMSTDINLLTVQEPDWEDVYDPMHLSSELNGDIENIYLSFEKMNGVKIKDRFETYKDILLNITNNYGVLSEDTVDKLYLYWKENTDFDYNHHTNTLYDLPICIPNENMSRKFNKWNQSYHYENLREMCLLKLSSQICYNIEKELKLKGEHKFSKKNIVKNTLVEEIDAQILKSTKSFEKQLRDNFKYNKKIDFKELSNDFNIRSEQYVKIISDMTNGMSKVNNEYTSGVMTKVEKELIEEDLNKSFTENEIKIKKRI